jgi:chromosome segregation ATPase
VWADIQDFARNPGKVLEKLRAQADAQMRSVAPVEVEQAINRAKIEEKQAERGRVIAAIRRGSISDDEADRELADLQRDIDILEARSEALSDRVGRAHELQDKLASADAVLRKLAAAVEGATDKTKRELIDFLVVGIRMDTVIEEGGKKRAVPTVTYAFEDVEQHIEHAAWYSGVHSGTPEGTALHLTQPLLCGAA